MKSTINKHSYFIALIVFTMVITTGFSQTEDTNDLENWSSINLEYKLNKKWSFVLEEQLRLDENISEIGEYFTQLNTEYSLSKKFKIGVGLRYIKENDNEGKIQGYEDHFRFHLETSYKHKIDNFTLKYRLRYQNKNELGVSNSEGDYANQNIRFKTSIEYNFKKWKLDPKISAEIFNHLEKGEENGFSKYRLSIGTDYKLKKIGTFGLFYGFEKELNETIPKTKNIIGLKYTYTIKNK
ncbi:DUF2490 domain-containing protein [Lutibacter citreus]|uniref:DUF2490 domain-containing protein n=1 Tax=Lutibacter citreus TaxID=2138210 RepID=UPI000DBE7447|nr:DUF2490 domain-containing protein [Lutibacter citreus]